MTNTVNATAYDTALGGTTYAECTTVQYDYEPSSNSTVLTVSPQSTLATMLNETPDQMKEQAEQNGTLRVYNEWSWWHPWYRIHYVCAYNTTMYVDYGLAVLPFANSLSYTNSFKQTMLSFMPKMLTSVATSICLADYLALVASEFGPPGFLAALTISLTSKMTTLIVNWNSVGGLISAFIASVVSTLLGFWKAGGLQLVQDLIDLLQQTQSLAEIGFGILYSIVSVGVSFAFQAIIWARLIQLGALP